jgi:hypothetical protein
MVKMLRTRVLTCAFLSQKCNRKFATFLCFGRKFQVVRLFKSLRRLLESERKEVPHKLSGGARVVRGASEKLAGAAHFYRRTQSQTTRGIRVAALCRKNLEWSGK